MLKCKLSIKNIEKICKKQENINNLKLETRNRARGLNLSNWWTKKSKKLISPTENGTVQVVVLPLAKRGGHEIKIFFPVIAFSIKTKIPKSPIIKI